MMRSQFDSPLKIVNSSTGALQVCGPLNWEGEETEAEVTITVTQSDDRATGSISGTFQRPGEEKDGQEWMFELSPAPSSKKFKKGSAQATGFICAMGGSAPAKAFNWSENVEVE